MHPLRFRHNSYSYHARCLHIPGYIPGCGYKGFIPGYTRVFTDRGSRSRCPGTFDTDPRTLRFTPNMSLSDSSLHPPHHTEAADDRSRPTFHTTATVIPAFQSLPIHPGQRRARSSTSPDRHLLASLTSRRRARATTRSQHPPLHIKLPAVERFEDQRPLPTVEDDFSDKPSVPIPIPAKSKKDLGSRPTTPLTGRASESIFSIRGPGPSIDSSLKPYYSFGFRKTTTHTRAPSTVQRGFSPMGSRRPASPLYAPTSPLSPTTPLQRLSVSPNAGRPVRNLKLPGLPRFHPANFPSADSSATNTPRGPRSNNSHQKRRNGSDAQQKLHQYQRDIVTNATKSSRSLLSSSINPKPTSPRLAPLGSPGDPMTPLMLEGQGDYLLAGSGVSSPGYKENDARELVECMVRRENERRRHPEVRSESLSPAVSPAGGRG